MIIFLVADFINIKPFFLYLASKNNKPKSGNNKNRTIDREQHWKIKGLKESAYMLGSDNLFSRPSIEMNKMQIRELRNNRHYI